MQNFSYFVSLEVAKKFGVVGGDGIGSKCQVATMFNLNASCFRVALSLVKLS